MCNYKYARVIAIHAGAFIFGAFVHAHITCGCVQVRRYTFLWTCLGDACVFMCDVHEYICKYVWFYLPIQHIQTCRWHMKGVHSYVLISVCGVVCMHDAHMCVHTQCVTGMYIYK